MDCGTNLASSIEWSSSMRPRSRVEQIHSELSALHRGDIDMCMSPGSSMSSEVDASSCNSSTVSGESSSGWQTVPVVSPEQMFALGRMVKEQRSGSSLASFSGSVEAGG